MDSRFRIRGLAREHPTLEDVFLAATRRTWEIVDKPELRDRSSTKAARQEALAVPADSLARKPGTTPPKADRS
jgi:hypothetical protein